MSLVCSYRYIYNNLETYLIELAWIYFTNNQQFLEFNK
jgi:hypothetical protein